MVGERGRSKSGNLRYLDELREMAKRNRNNPTIAEDIFWKKVLQCDKTEYRFLRQKPINRFILDFYCSKLLLVIEIDGDSHRDKEFVDKERDLLLEKYQIRTIRFTNDQVLNELEKVKNDLDKIIIEREKLIFR